MKKILIMIIVGIFLTSGFGASAFQVTNIKPYIDNIEFNEYSASKSPKDYTHTVLVEVGTATWCPSCPASNTAWHNIYNSGDYDFEYCELITDKNSVASSHMNKYSLHWVPTSYFDGGQYVSPGTSYSEFYDYLDSSGSRSVPDLDASLNVAWQDPNKIEIDVSIKNNDASAYPGTLRVYIIELESSMWNDYNGNPYYHAFLDFAINEEINIPAGNNYNDNLIWDGAAEGYPNIDEDNIQVILAVFDETPHQSYSDPPSGSPFNAYYVDECVSAEPGQGSTNDPPNAPTIEGPTNGVINIEYNFTFNSIDPNGDDVYYHIKWGDGYIDKTSYAPNGTDVIATHTYKMQNTFTIQVKAIDTYDDESDWTELEITIPRSRQNYYNLINYLFEKFPKLHLIINQLY